MCRRLTTLLLLIASLALPLASQAESTVWIGFGLGLGGKHNESVCDNHGRCLVYDSRVPWSLWFQWRRDKLYLEVGGYRGNDKNVSNWWIGAGPIFTPFRSEPRLTVPVGINLAARQDFNIGSALRFGLGVNWRFHDTEDRRCDLGWKHQSNGRRIFNHDQRNKGANFIAVQCSH